MHQFEHPSYRIECKPESKPSSSKASAKGSSKAVRDIHLSYHDGEHYNSVRVLLTGKDGGGGSAGNRFGGLRGDGCSSAEVDEEETGDDRQSAVSGVADGVSGVQLAGEAAEDDEAAALPAEADGESGESAPEPLSQQESKPDVKLKPKERRKEEKRLRKEQKHREAVAAAGGVDAAAEVGGGGAGEQPGGRSMIVL